MLYRVPYESVTLMFSLGYALSITFLLSVGLHIRAKKIKDNDESKTAIEDKYPNEQFIGEELASSCVST